MDERLRERLWLAGAGGAQGLAIWLLIEVWPEAHAARAAAVSLLTFLAVTALVYHFAWTGASHGRLLAVTAGVGALYAAIAGWVGWSMLPDVPSRSSHDARAFVWFLTSLVTLYVLGPFLQIHQRTGRMRFPYRDLFLHGWNNFFIALVGGLFVNALWLVLILWGALFDLVGIELFEDLFSEEIFIWTVTGAAAGFGIALGRESERVVATLRSITLSVFRGLLPLVSFVAVIFLLTLPFTGPDGLWETNHASQLLLTWVGLTVLFLNAVYQDGSGESPLAAPVRRLVEAALVAMTGYVAISVYGISLRIAQYGLTPERFWGVLFTVVLGAYAGGYALAVLRRGTPWLRAVRAVNLLVALLVVALGLLAHTPLLDPIARSARSQYARLAEGRTPAADFDYGYLEFELGQQGRAALAALEALDAHPEIETIRREIAMARASENYWQWKQQHGPSVGPEDFDVHPAGTPLPEGLIEAARRGGLFAGQGACEARGSCAVFPANLDGSPPDEWVIVVGRRGLSNLYAFSVGEDGGFTSLGQLQSQSTGKPRPDELADLLASGGYRVVAPEFRDLEIGDTRYRLVPSH